MWSWYLNNEDFEDANDISNEDFEEEADDILNPKSCNEVKDSHFAAHAPHLTMDNYYPATYHWYHQCNVTKGDQEGWRELL